MGWSGPGCQRHRAARTRVGHAAAGHRCRWLEGACAFVRSARLRDGFVRFFGRGGPCLWGRRPGRGARDHAARRGQRHGAMPYASIADDSEVVRNRPIKCCDGFHSISHYHPAAAIRGEDARNDVWLSGNPDGRGNAHVCPDATGQVKSRSRCSDTRCAIHPVTRTGSRQRAHGGKPHRASHEPPSGRRTGPTEIEWNANGIGTTRTHSVTRVDGVGKRGNTARRELAGPSIGHLAAAEEAGRVFADLAGDDGPAGRRAESRVGCRRRRRAGARFAHRAAPAAISPSRGDGDACGGGSHDRRDRRNRARTSCATCCRQAPRRHRRRPPHPAGRPCGRPSRCLPRYLRRRRGRRR